MNNMKTDLDLGSTKKKLTLMISLVFLMWYFMLNPILPELKNGPNSSIFLSDTSEQIKV